MFDSSTQINLNFLLPAKPVDEPHGQGTFMVNAHLRAIAAHRLIPYLALILAVFAAYGNVYSNAFLYDDESLILKNVFLRDWHAIGSMFKTSITAGANIPGGFYRPLQILLYLVIYQLFGTSLFAYHFINVALHAANALLVFRLGKKLRFKPLASFTAALLWALHPVHVEAVTYISSTADALYVFFTLIGLLLLVPRFAARRFLPALVMMLCALLSKEEAVLFPVLVMACAFLLDKNRSNPRTYIRFWPFWVLAIAYVLAHKFLLSFGDFDLHHTNDVYANSVWCRILTFLATIPHYVGFLVWPFHLHYDRDFQPVTEFWNLSVLGGVIVMAAGAGIISRARERRGLLLSWALLWFVAADLLHTGILVPVNASLLEHWLYLPSVGLFLGGSQAVAITKMKDWQRRAMVGIAGSLVLFLLFLTHQQNKIWHDAENFYLNIFANGEPSPHAHNNLGIEYTLRGEYKKALEQYELSIQYSGDTNAATHHNLAITLLNGPEAKNYTQEAMRHLKRALEIDHDYYPASLALAEMYRTIGDNENAAFYDSNSKEIKKHLTGAPLRASSK